MIKKLTLTAVIVAVLAGTSSTAFAAKAHPHPKTSVQEPIYFKLATGEM